MKIKEKRSAAGRFAAAVLGALLLAAVVFLLPVSAQRAQAAEAVRIEQCLIQGENVVVTASARTVPASDDGLYYLIANQTYQEGAAGRQAATAPAAGSATFTFALRKNQPDSQLFNKFVVATKQNGVMTPVSGAKYITNPEATATHTQGRRSVGKKGILPAVATINSGLLKETGTNQVVYNLPVGNLCSGSGISYQYNGKTYHFSSAIVGQYDQIVPSLNRQGIQITLVLLNNLTGDSTLIHPLSRDNAGANYYAFNTAEQAGVEKLEAVASFLGERYSGTGHGTVDNWVVGNEVNARNEWNYMTPVDVGTFAAEYAKAVRIFYNGIKAQNGNANVYISIDQQWSRPSNAALYYAGRSFLDTFNGIVSAEGNIDWHVAIHPYNVPLYDPRPWNPSGLVQHSVATPYLTIQNIDVLTDYLGQSAYLSPTGQVRSVLCSEVGYTSLQGEDVQAAALMYAYWQAANNSHIDGIIFSRQQDDAGEIAQGLANGISNLDGSHKLAWDFYVNMNGANAAQYLATASAIAGMDLSQVVTVR